MKLLEPIKVGNITLKNRAMFPPLKTGYEGENGSITSKSIAFYERLAINKIIATGDIKGVCEKLHHDMNHFVNEVSEEALDEIINKVCACAVRAQKAGVDIIQIHGDRLVDANIKVIKVGDCKERVLYIENAIKTGYDSTNEI